MSDEWLEFLSTSAMYITVDLNLDRSNSLYELLLINMTSEVYFARTWAYVLWWLFIAVYGLGLNEHPCNLILLQ